MRAAFYNGVDYARWVGGELPEGAVRKVEVEALVDTGATYPALPRDLVRELGLAFRALTRRVHRHGVGGVRGEGSGKPATRLRAMVKCCTPILSRRRRRSRARAALLPE